MASSAVVSNEVPLVFRTSDSMPHDKIVSSESQGREWSKMAVRGGEILKGCGLLLLTIISVAALVIGIAALVNPGGLALVGTGIGAAVTSVLAFGAENAIAVVVVGSVGTGLLCIAAAISLLSSDKDEVESSSSG